jgi:2-keto-3-deoxy-L-rhamnonate aldolase RhmA
MALSQKAKKRFEASMAKRAEAQEILAAIEAGGNPQAAAVAALGVLAAVGAVDVADAGPADVALAGDVDARIASLQAKIDAVIAALKAAGLMAS